MWQEETWWLAQRCTEFEGLSGRQPVIDGFLEEERILSGGILFLK